MISVLDKRILAYLGLAQRAGSLTSGDTAIRKVLKRGNVKLLILAEDAAASTVSELYSLANEKGTPVLIFGKKEEIGRAIGKAQRFGVAVTDDNFALKLKQAILTRDKK